MPKHSRKPTRIRKTVYVIGAGFSVGLGYPLTKSLLIDAWSRIPKDSRTQLKKIIEFHHPGFSSARALSFPNIEQLLTEMAVNLQMFDASRPAEGRFTKQQLKGGKSGTGSCEEIGFVNFARGLKLVPISLMSFYRAL